MSAEFELTEDEARVILAAKYGDAGQLTRYGGGWLVLVDGALFACGSSPREALESAAVAIDLPLIRSKFSNFGDTVKLGDQFIAKARSASMARRIAAALTFYKKDR